MLVTGMTMTSQKPSPDPAANPSRNFTNVRSKNSAPKKAELIQVTDSQYVTEKSIGSFDHEDSRPALLNASLDSVNSAPRMPKKYPIIDEQKTSSSIWASVAGGHAPREGHSY